MTAPSEEYALLMAAATQVDADLARQLLEEAGIPCLLHGMDRDLAELGSAIHMQISRPDIYVPRGALDEAVEVLRGAWEDFAPPARS